MIALESVPVGLSANTFCAYFSLTVSGGRGVFGASTTTIVLVSLLSHTFTLLSEALFLLQHKQEVKLLVIGYRTIVELGSTLAADMMCKTQHHARIASVSVTTLHFCTPTTGFKRHGHVVLLARSGHISDAVPKTWS